ncbi:hypothetical protein J2127_000487, partial [Methanococcus voltae]|nr:hypothetical protein [Methanococcus voltae]
NKNILLSADRPKAVGHRNFKRKIGTFKNAKKRAYAEAFNGSNPC